MFFEGEGDIGRAAQSAGAEVVFAPRHKSKCSRHNWEGKGKNEKKIMKKIKTIISPSSAFFSVNAVTSFANDEFRKHFRNFLARTFVKDII